MLESLQQAITRVQSLRTQDYKLKLTNTFGVVVESDEPRWTSGTDLIQTLRLVDASCPDGVQLCVFSRDVDAMPKCSLGDVLELTNVVVQFWQDRPQLFAKMSRPHAFAFRRYSFNTSTIPSPELTQPVQQYNTTGDSHHAAEMLPRLQALRREALGHASAVDSTSVYLRRIRDLAPPEAAGQRPPCVDMRVKVLAVDARQQSCEAVVMYVWDATDAKPVSASLQLLPSVWKGTELQLSQPRRYVMPLVSSPPGLQVMQDLPPFGTALPVIVEPGAVPSTGLPRVGDFIKIKVVGVAAVQGQWQVVFGKPSRLTQSQPSQGFDVYFNTRLANNDTCEWPQDLSKVVTSCSIPSLPRSTVRQVLLQTAEQQPGPFRVLLRLVGYLPQDLQQWCKARPQQQEASGPVWEWAAHLWLEDSTGEVRALLLGQEGTQLLGIPPQDLSNNRSALQQLQARLQHLTSVNDEGGVWLDVALTPLYPAQQRVNPQQQQQLQAALLSRSSPQREQQHDGEEDEEEEEGQGGALRHEEPPVGGQQLQEGQSPRQPPLEASRRLQPAEDEQANSLQRHGQGQDLEQQPVFVLHDAVILTQQVTTSSELGPPQQQQQQQQQQVREQQHIGAHRAASSSADCQHGPKRCKRAARDSEG